GGGARGGPPPRTDGRLRRGGCAPRGPRGLSPAGRGHGRRDARRRRRATRRIPPARHPPRRRRGKLVTARLTSWLASLSRRERTLLAAGGVVRVVVLVLGRVVVLRDTLAALGAGVGGQEGELGGVRRLAARLRQGGGRAAGAPSGALFTRLQ